MVADYETIRVEVTGPSAVLTMNRPERLNGMTNLMLRETYFALQELAADDDVRVLVLTGAGRGFCPGADILHAASGAPDVELEAEWFQVPVLLHNMSAVTIAAVNGACAGAGLGWAMACDVRYAARSAKFNTAFLSVAVAGDMGLPWSLARLIGPARARELSFFPGKFDAAEAARIGLVNAVFDDDLFRTEVAARAAHLAAAAPAALRTMKANYVTAEQTTFDAFVRHETEQHLKLLAAPENAAAFRAFVERRTANHRAAAVA
jgi:2-(1,2-epoxy-1,2-dihydrophenyl)acetyl-CoA isomerase